MPIYRLCIFLTLILSLPVQAETIAVIGTGNVGSALGTELAIQGHTIPLIVEQPMKFVFGVKTSIGEMIQEAAPDALVVKAFNSISTQLMSSPEDKNGPVHVPIVGNDSAAKERVAGIVTAMGLVPIDLGSIEVAHWTEYGVVVGLNNQLSERPNYDIVFREK